MFFVLLKIHLNKNHEKYHNVLTRNGFSKFKRIEKKTSLNEFKFAFTGKTKNEAFLKFIRSSGIKHKLSLKIASKSTLECTEKNKVKH